MQPFNVYSYDASTGYDEACTLANVMRSLNSEIPPGLHITTAEEKGALASSYFKWRGFWFSPCLPIGNAPTDVFGCLTSSNSTTTSDFWIVLYLSFT